MSTLTSLTIEQARTLTAVAQHGSFAKAAKALNKVPSAVVYSLKTLEDAAGVPLFDRSGYRSTLTPIGHRVLEQCQKLLAVAADFDDLCQGIRAGSEPYLKVVFDGLLEVAPILAAARAIGGDSPNTRISLFSEFLGDVEARFDKEQADVMISVVPPLGRFETEVKLSPLPSMLVAHRDHPLVRRKGKIELRELESHTFLTVRGSDERLRLSTSALEKAAVFRLSDFHAKKVALLTGMGYGWMPEYLIEGELKKHRLAVIRWGQDHGRHVFQPTLYLRGKGQARDAFVGALRSQRT